MTGGDGTIIIHEETKCPAFARAGGAGEDGEEPQPRLGPLAGPPAQRSLRRGGTPAGLAVARGVQAGGTGRQVPPDPPGRAGAGPGRGTGRLDTGRGEARREVRAGGGPAADGPDPGRGG